MSKGGDSTILLVNRFYLGPTFWQISGVCPNAIIKDICNRPNRCYTREMSSLTTSIEKQIDKFALSELNRRVPDSFEASCQDTASLEEILARTEVVVPPDNGLNNGHPLLSAGYHPVFLETATGLLRCGLKVHLADDPAAPLLLFHHGFNEYPADRGANRLFANPEQFQAHIVFIQAPFHTNWLEPIEKGFASLHNLYQMLAGSLCLMSYVHNHFKAQGAPYTAVAGVSWGGITSILYQSIFNQARVVIPLLSGPNLAQVLLDIADLFDRPISLAMPRMQEALDFTPYYQRCDQELIFPLLAENDLFFRLDHHAEVFSGRPLVTVPQGHITGYWNIGLLRQHILDVLDWARECNCLPDTQNRHEFKVKQTPSARTR